MRRNNFFSMNFISTIIALVICFTFFFSFFTLQVYSFAQEAEKTEEKEKKKKALDSLFEMSFEELMKVRIITAAKAPQEIGDIPASVVILTRRDIQRYGYGTLAEILENIPGLYGINDYSFQGMNFGVRGFWSGVANDNIMILVNGVQQVFDPASSYPLATLPVPVEAIDRIDVVRGPMSVVYGSGAFFGVINIITNAHIQDESVDTTSLVALTTGSEKTNKVMLRLTGNKSGLYYVFNGSFYDTEGIDQPLAEMMSNPAILPFFNVPVHRRTGGQLEITRKYFDFSARYKGIQLNLTHAQSDQELYFSLPSFKEGNQNRMFSTRISLGYRTELSRIFTLEGRFNFTNLRDWYRLDYLFKDFYGYQQIESQAFEVEVNAFVTPSESLDITSGLYYRALFDVYNHYDLPSFGSPSLINQRFQLVKGESIVTRAFFTQATYKPSSRLKLVAGVRFEQMPTYEMEAFMGGGTPDYQHKNGSYDSDNIEVIPRFAAVYAFNSRNIVKLLYGKAINRSSFLQNQRNIFVSQKGALEPERIQTLELNYIAAISSQISLNASLFHNRLDNLITRVVEFDSQSGSYSTWSGNAGEMITNGTEITLFIHPVEDMTLELSGTCQETKNTKGASENISVAYSPRFLGYVKAAYDTPAFSLALTGFYVDKMETFWDETLADEIHPLGQRIGNQVPGYFNLSANLRLKDLFTDGFYINLRLTNLINTEIRYPTFTNNSWTDLGTLGKGRAWLLSAGYTF